MNNSNSSKQKRKTSFVWDIYAWPLREQETLKYHGDSSSASSHYPDRVQEPVSQRKGCRLGNLHSVHLSCGVPCKSRVFYFIFTRHSRCCGFPTSPRAAISLSPRPQTFPHHHSEICELRETDVLSAWRSTRAQERLAAGGGREGRREISFKQIFLPAPLTLQSRGVSYQPRQHTARQLQPAACPPTPPAASQPRGLR